MGLCCSHCSKDRDRAHGENVITPLWLFFSWCPTGHVNNHLFVNKDQIFVCLQDGCHFFICPCNNAFLGWIPPGILDIIKSRICEKFVELTVIYHSLPKVFNVNTHSGNNVSCVLTAGWWNQKMIPFWLNILFTEWKRCDAGFVGLGIFIINWQRVASVKWSSRSNVEISHVIHISIWLRKHSWCAQRQSAFALAWELVKIWYSNKLHFYPKWKDCCLQWVQSLNPALVYTLINFVYFNMQSFNWGRQFWSIWVWFSFSHFFVLSLIALKQIATWMPVNSQISLLNASWS